MATVITVSKHSFGYVVTLGGLGGRPFSYVLQSHHPDVAATAVLHEWENHRHDFDGVTVNVPPEVEAAIRARGPLPWDQRA
jgi:hypothetical protein